MWRQVFNLPNLGRWETSHPFSARFQGVEVRQVGNLPPHRNVAASFQLAEPGQMGNVAPVLGAFPRGRSSASWKLAATPERGGKFSTCRTKQLLRPHESATKGTRIR